VADEQSYEMTGETLGLWRLTAGIGRGGMGEVYAAEYDYEHVVAAHVPPTRRAEVRAELAKLPRAEQGRLVSQIIGFDLPHEARFAIKVCNSRNGTAGYKRFLQEADVARRLGDHPYIVTVHAVNGGFEDATTGMYRRFELDRGKHKDVAFMVMDLASITIDRARLTVGEAVHVVRCIAQALDHAHAQGVIHRDLKPENILGTIDHPLLTDFGIAKEMDASEGLTRTGQIIGTLDYMSPEQATDAKHVDPRSDVYSLGVVLYEFATQGGLPYSHKQDRDSCLASIRSERIEPKWPREHLAGFPVALERIILKAMAHRIEDRYRTMAEFVADLDRFSRGERIGWIGRIPLRAMMRFQLHRHPRLAWGIAAGLLVPVLAAGGVWFSRWIDHDRRTYEKGLISVAVAVDAIRQGRQQQPTREEAEILRKLQPLKQEPSYGELRERLGTLEELLVRHRSLKAVFRADRSRNEQADGNAALGELKLAANASNPPWISDGEGLRINDASEINLRPYGRGAVFVWLVASLPASNWQLLRISEDVTYPARTLTCQIAGDVLQFALRQDERPPTALRQERVPSLRLSLACELSATRIRTWVGRSEQVYPVPGIAAEAPAAIVLTLPAGAVLERLEILPRTWN
jgi:serine/threonine protein kinase